MHYPNKVAMALLNYFDVLKLISLASYLWLISCLDIIHYVFLLPELEYLTLHFSHDFKLCYNSIASYLENV